MQKGPDGNYHVPWVTEQLWNNIGFFDWGSDNSGVGGGSGGGGRSGNYTNSMGMSSADVLSQMIPGDVFGRNKFCEYGFWRNFTFSPADRGYEEEGAFGNTLSEVAVGAGKQWVAFAGAPY